MTQEIVPEADIPMRAFDQPRDISDGRAAVVVQLNDADARPQSREWVRRHFGCAADSLPSSVDLPAFG
jgi:hypothetical protein